MLTEDGVLACLGFLASSSLEGALKQAPRCEQSWWHHAFLSNGSTYSKHCCLMAVPTLDFGAPDARKRAPGESCVAGSVAASKAAAKASMHASFRFDNGASKSSSVGP